MVMGRLRPAIRIKLALSNPRARVSTFGPVIFSKDSRTRRRTVDLSMRHASYLEDEAESRSRRLTQPFEYRKAEVISEGRRGSVQLASRLVFTWKYSMFGMTREPVTRQRRGVIVYDGTIPRTIRG